MSIHDGTVVPYLYLLYIQYIKRWKAREPNYPSMQRPLSELDRIPLGILSEMNRSGSISAHRIVADHGTKKITQIETQKLQGSKIPISL